MKDSSSGSIGHSEPLTMIGNGSLRQLERQCHRPQNCREGKTVRKAVKLVCVVLRMIDGQTMRCIGYDIASKGEARRSRNETEDLWVVRVEETEKLEYKEPLKLDKK